MVSAANVNVTVTASYLEQAPMVWSIARRIARRYPSTFEVEDLAQIGMMSLMATADRIDEGSGPAALSYARIRAQGAMVDALRKSDFVPRSVRSRARRLADTRERLTREHGRAPTVDELARSWSTSPKQFEQMERGTQVMALVPLDDTRADGEERRHEPIPSDETPFEHAARRDVAETVTAAISTLPERDQIIVRLYYFDDVSLRDIGARLGVTESRVSQLLTRAKARLAEALAGTLQEEC